MPRPRTAPVVYPGIPRKARVRVLGAGVVRWLVCDGCGRTGNIESGEPEALSVMAIRHSKACPVRLALDFGQTMWRAYARVERTA